MASIYTFCDISELRNWIVVLCLHEELGIVYFGRSDDTGKTAKPEDFVLTEDIYQIFLFQKGTSIPHDLDLNDVLQREWGWINISPGGVKNLDFGTCLILSEIHGEKSDHPTGNPDRWVRWLKQKIKPEVNIGVIGKNLKSAGTSVYNDIWYTNMAHDLFNSGTIWKQHSSDNSIFEPIS
jgi:hypothetical protein